MLFFSFSSSAQPNNSTRTGLTAIHTFPLKTKVNSDLAQQPSALSPLSAAAPSDEPLVAAAPPFLHQTLYLKRSSIQIITDIQVFEIHELYRGLSLV